MKGLVNRLRLSSGILLAGVVVAALLLYRLGNLMAGVSSREATMHAQSVSLHEIAHHATYWHYHLLMWLFGWIPGHQTWVLRLASVVYAGLALAALVYILRRWYGPRSALFGLAIVSLSAIFLHVGRLATPDVVFFAAIPIMLASNLFLYDDPDRKLGLYLWLVVQILALAIPGMIWFVLLNVFHHRRDLRQAFEEIYGWLPISIVSAIIIFPLIPIVSGLLLGEAKAQAIQLLGLPQTIPTLSEIGRHTADTFLTISARGTMPNDVWLNHLPVLDSALTILLVLGIYFYARHLSAPRTHLIAEYTLLAFVLVSAGGAVTFSLLAPLLYLLVAAGLAYLLHLWLKVFPRNPVARSLGIGLLGLVIFASCAYSFRQYFVAWPHHPEAVHAFYSVKLPRSSF